MRYKTAGSIGIRPGRVEGISGVCPPSFMQDDSVPADGQEEAALEVRLFGRVHGVGFRYFTYELARRLELVGYVMNVCDGSVRAYAEGQRSVLENFLASLRRGPGAGSVHEVRTRWGTPTGLYDTFRIECTM